MDSDSGWVVVGIDTGGTSNNATVLDPSKGFLVDRLVETHAGSPRAPRWPSTPWPGRWTTSSTSRASRRRRSALWDWTRPARPRPTGSSPPGGDQLRPAGVAGLRRPGALEVRLGLPVVSTTTPTRPPSTPTASATGAKAAGHSSVSAIVGTGLAAAWSRAGGSSAGGRYGRRVRPRPDPHARPAGRGPAAAGVQLRLRGRRREHRLADRDRTQPAPLLADPVREPRAGPGRRPQGGGQAGPRLRRAGGPAGSGDLRAAGDGHRPAVHHRRQLQRPRHLLPGRRRGRVHAHVPPVVPGQRCASTPPCARSRPGWPAWRWSPTGTWPAPAGPPSRPLDALQAPIRVRTSL